MKKVIIVLGALFVVSQAWGAERTEERSTFISCDSSTRMVTEFEKLAMTSEIQARKLKALRIAHTADLNENEIEKSKKDITEHCGKLDFFIKAAAEGNDKVYDNLMSTFDEFVTDRYLGANATKYQRKLEMAQQRALLKAKQAEGSTVKPSPK